MPSPRKHYVLYVDDDPQECELVGILAETMPDRLIIETLHGFHDAQDHLEKLSSGVYHDIRSPDFLLLDYHLGLHTGTELLAWMKTRPLPAFPVAIFSNCDNQVDIMDCYHAGASFFLTKPPSSKRLLTMLATIRRCISAPKPDFEALRLLEDYRPPLHGFREGRARAFRRSLK